MSLVLWGERAHAFDGDNILRLGQDRPVVAVFVGTLVKPFEGSCRCEAYHAFLTVLVAYFSFDTMYIYDACRP